MRTLRVPIASQASDRTIVDDGEDDAITNGRDSMSGGLGAAGVKANSPSLSALPVPCLASY